MHWSIQFYDAESLGSITGNQMLFKQGKLVTKPLKKPNEPSGIAGIWAKMRQKCKTKGQSFVFMSGKYVSAPVLIRFMTKSWHISSRSLSSIHIFCVLSHHIVEQLFRLYFLYFTEGYNHSSIFGHSIFTKKKIFIII